MMLMEMEMEMERVTTTMLYYYDSVLAVILWFRFTAGPEEEDISPHLRDPLCACSVIRSLVDFHAEVLNDEDNMRTIISFISDRPRSTE